MINVQPVGIYVMFTMLTGVCVLCANVKTLKRRKQTRVRRNSEDFYYIKRRDRSKPRKHLKGGDTRTACGLELGFSFEKWDAIVSKQTDIICGSCLRIQTRDKTAFPILSAATSRFL